ncbi:hypothetical protein [Streptomyces sp. TR02-1]|uniref:hypothetical protein n=1 Tax=Streptomyces sp. TR02-1 TaxID=3385977 RepID=UPI0039A069CB
MCWRPFSARPRHPNGPDRWIPSSRSRQSPDLAPPLAPGETELLLEYRQRFGHEHRRPPLWRRSALRLARALAHWGPAPCSCEEVSAEIRSGVHLHDDPGVRAACGVELTRSTNDPRQVTCLGCRVVSTM